MRKCQICDSNLDYDNYCLGENAHTTIRQLKAKIHILEERNNELQQQLYRHSKEAFTGNIEACDKLGLDVMKIQPVLMAVQNGDISTGKARELIRCWILGTYSNDLLPKGVSNDPITEVS